MEVTALRVEWDDSGVERRYFTCVVSVLVMSIPLFLWYPKFEEFTDTGSRLKKGEILLTIGVWVMVSKRHKHILLRIWEFILHHAYDCFQCLSHRILIDVWVIVWSAIACPEHQIWFLHDNLVQNALESSLWWITSFILHSIFSSHLGLTISSCTLWTTAIWLVTIGDRTHRILHVHVGVRELDDFDSLSRCCTCRYLFVKSINEAISIFWFTCHYSIDIIR